MIHARIVEIDINLGCPECTVCRNEKKTMGNAVGNFWLPLPIIDLQPTGKAPHYILSRTASV